jgi:hypothetical protein
MIRGELDCQIKQKMIERKRIFSPVLLKYCEELRLLRGRAEGRTHGGLAPGLSPNLSSRFTPGTLISSYEVYKLFRRSVACPSGNGMLRALGTSWS